MYRMGHRKKNIKHHFYILIALILAIMLLASVLWWYLSQSKTPDITQTTVSTHPYNPGSPANIKIDNPLYTMELPAGWEQTSVNRDTRYNSTQWQMQDGSKNRWIELYTDRLPTDTAFNKILPVSINKSEIIIDTLSDNCSKFTTKVNEANLKVVSKWQNAPFLCDLSNMTDNIIGVSDKTTGVTLNYTGAVNGKHTYMFIYTDRGIPEDERPIKIALQTLAPK